MTRRQVLALSAAYNSFVLTTALARPKPLRKLVGLPGDSWSPMEIAGLFLVGGIGATYAAAALEGKRNRPVEALCSYGKISMIPLAVSQIRSGRAKPAAILPVIPDLVLGLSLLKAQE